jgi:rare lipoprotein A
MANLFPLVILCLLFGCVQAISHATRVQYGEASWYGDTFHGQPTASGEIYDMFQLTAAHRQAPLGSYAMVTNLDTGHSVQVRINDRGPFKKGRIIDLSHAAARQLDMLESGIARVKVEFLPPPTTSATFMVQAGAYRQQHNATQVQRALAKHYPSARVITYSQEALALYRVYLGPFPTRTKADHVAHQVRTMGYTSMVLSLP